MRAHASVPCRRGAPRDDRLVERAQGGGAAGGARAAAGCRAVGRLGRLRAHAPQGQCQEVALTTPQSRGVAARRLSDHRSKPCDTDAQIDRTQMHAQSTDAFPFPPRRVRPHWLARSLACCCPNPCTHRSLAPDRSFPFCCSPRGCCGHASSARFSQRALIAAGGGTCNLPAGAGGIPHSSHQPSVDQHTYLPFASVAV
jgi:hypothetical protein